MTKNEEKTSCPKCNGTNLTIHGHTTANTVTDYYSEDYELFRCNECRYEFSSSRENDKK